MIVEKFNSVPSIIGVDLNSTIRNFNSYSYYNIYSMNETRRAKNG